MYFNLVLINFDFDKVATYPDANVARIMNTAIIENAKCFKQIRNQHGTFSDYLWKYSDGKKILYEKHDEGYIPASNGFKFLGEVTIYSHLQACGIINDHGSKCERYQQILQKYPIVKKERNLEKKKMQN